MKSIIKQVEFKVEAQTWPLSNVPPRIQQLAGAQQIDLLELALLIAFYTAPPQGYGFERSYQWAALRYLPAFDTSNTMVLRPEWNDVDAHQKTVLSDDFGFGFGAYVAEQCLGPGALLNTGYFLELALRHQIGNFPYVEKSKRGPSKMPDFTHVRTSSAHIDLIECKGSQTSNYLKRVANRAKDQKSNLTIDPSAPSKVNIGQRLVVGASISQRSSFPSYCTVSDPTRPSPLPNLSHDEFLLLAARYDLARSTALMGLPALSAFFWLGDEVRTIARSEADQRRRHLRQRSNLRGPKEGTRTILDLPRAMERQDVLLPSLGGEIVSLDIRMEIPSSVFQWTSAGLPVNRIAEMVVQEIRAAATPERPRQDAEKVVETPFGSSMSVEYLTRDERADVTPDG